MKSSSAPQERRVTAPRESSSTATAQTQPRRQIHGGGISAPVRYSVATETAADGPSSRAPRVRSSWRATLVGALVGLLIVLVLLMKWLLEFQVTAAAERRDLEAAARAEVARCFELASPGVVDACRKGKNVNGSSEFKRLKSDQSKP